jgi:ATP-dependent Clp protease ATP-binding subunit ClpA
MDAESFARLTARVKATAASSDPLDGVAAAIAVAADLTAQSDALVDHFVGQARTAGRSWTEIGDRLGVSRQAARKRFTDTAPSVVLPPEVVLRPRLQTCLARATDLAQAAGAPEVGAEHLLAGLLADGVAATILDTLGVTADAIAAATVRLFGPAGAPGEVEPALSAETVCAIEAAAQRAAHRADEGSHVSVGTEHLLAVLALDHGSRAHRILRDLDVDIAAVKKELACYLTLNPPRARRRQRRRATAAGCSFCGTPPSPTRPLAYGPNVQICAVCAQRAHQNLAARPTA